MREETYEAVTQTNGNRTTITYVYSDRESLVPSELFYTIVKDSYGVARLADLIQRLDQMPTDEFVIFHADGYCTLTMPDGQFFSTYIYHGIPSADSIQSGMVVIAPTLKDMEAWRDYQYRSYPGSMQLYPT